MDLTEAIKVYIDKDEWMKKTWYIHKNEILLNLKNEWNNAICSDMNVPRDGLGHIVSK